MDIFKDVVLTWWQTGLFKVAMLAAGLAAGAYWSAFFVRHLKWLIAIAVVGCAYIMYVWLLQ